MSSEPKLEPLGLEAGIWRGRITGPATLPTVEVSHRGNPLIGVEVAPETGDEGGGKAGGKGWIVSVPVPSNTLSDGVQTFLVAEPGGPALGCFAIMAGAPPEPDLRSELALLRAELEVLKRAFRRRMGG